MDHWLTLFLATAIAASSPSGPRLAPADEYFGRSQMSPIEITNRIREAERRGASYARLATMQAAIEDWERRYPGDPWIAPREYRMSHLFGRLHSRLGDAEATRCRTLLRERFAQSPYAIASLRDSVVNRVVPKAAPKPTATPAKRPVAKSGAKKRRRFLGIVF